MLQIVLLYYSSITTSKQLRTVRIISLASCSESRYICVGQVPSGACRVYRRDSGA